MLDVKILCKWSIISEDLNVNCPHPRKTLYVCRHMVILHELNYLRLWGVCKCPLSMQHIRSHAHGLSSTLTPSFSNSRLKWSKVSSVSSNSSYQRAVWIISWNSLSFMHSGEIFASLRKANEVTILKNFAEIEIYKM